MDVPCGPYMYGERGARCRNHGTLSFSPCTGPEEHVATICVYDNIEDEVAETGGMGDVYRPAHLAVEKIYLSFC